MEKVVKDIQPQNIVVNSLQDERNISKESKSLILKHRLYIASHSYFPECLFEFKTYIQQTHELYDHWSSGNINPLPNEPKISNQIISKSSQKSTILQIEKEKLKNMGVTNYFFNNKPENDRKFTHHVYCDPMYNNCLVIPLKHMITENDNPLLYDRSQETYQDKDQDYNPNTKKAKPLKKYILELVNVFDVHAESNTEIRETILQFFTGILFNIDTTIKKVVKNESTRVLLIVHRNRILSNNGTIDNESIVGAVMFGGHSKDGFTVNYLAVSTDD